MDIRVMITCNCEHYDYLLHLIDNLSESIPQDKLKCDTAEINWNIAHTICIHVHHVYTHIQCVHIYWHTYTIYIHTCTLYILIMAWSIGDMHIMRDPDDARHILLTAVLQYNCNIMQIFTHF